MTIASSHLISAEETSPAPFKLLSLYGQMLRFLISILIFDDHCVK